MVVPAAEVVPVVDEQVPALAAPAPTPATSNDAAVSTTSMAILRM
jgi:hypothetical protein